MPIMKKVLKKISCKHHLGTELLNNYTQPTDQIRCSSCFSFLIPIGSWLFPGLVSDSGAALNDQEWLSMPNYEHILALTPNVVVILENSDRWSKFEQNVSYFLLQNDFPPTKHLTDFMSFKV
ncbi:hypothetical protein CR513_53257, partial [Mucuna pruriens]